MELSHLSVGSMFQLRMLDLKSAVTELLVRKPCSCRACSYDSLIILYSYVMNAFGIGYHWAHYNIDISVPKWFFFYLHRSRNHIPNDERIFIGLDWNGKKCKRITTLDFKGNTSVTYTFRLNPIKRFVTPRPLPLCWKFTIFFFQFQVI